LAACNNRDVCKPMKLSLEGYAVPNAGNP